MKGGKIHFSSASAHWSTPKAVYDALHEEFRFTMDACPYGGAIESLMPWEGERVYCNPPYGRGIGDWLRRAREADLAVYLIPARTDTRWWHNYVMGADEIRFLRGRLKFGDAKHSAPFPSCLAIYGIHLEKGVGMKRLEHVGSEAGEEARFDTALRAVATNLLAWADEVPAMFAEIPRLKAELAAERERYAKLLADHVAMRESDDRDYKVAVEKIANLEAENARLRSQLKGKTFPAEEPR